MQELVQKRLKATERGEEPAVDISDQSIADEILVGWDGIVDGDGEPVPFSQASKAILLDVPTMAGALIGAYFESLAEQKTKN